MKPHIKNFNYERTYDLPIDEVNRYAESNSLKIIAMTAIFGGSTIQQSLIVSFEPWEYSPPLNIAKQTVTPVTFEQTAKNVF